MVELVKEENQSECIDFLEARKETCLFLLGNMNSFSFRLGEHLNSGNYRILRRDGEISGVFTVQNERRQGYSRLCMKKLIEDSAKVHSLDSLILFTGEENVAARKLYESLGFKLIGDFGLIFGDSKLS